MTRPGRYPQEMRERAVRMVRERRGEYPSEWAAITSVSQKLGINHETLRIWCGARRPTLENAQA